jgi:hypothetical protein
MGGALGFNGYVTVPGPTGGFWRVTSWDEPFDPPPPAPALGGPARDDCGHRYDDPHGEHRTLYCATNAEGALGECLGDFVFCSAAARRVEAFLVDEPDEGFDENYHRPLFADDIDAFRWKLAHAPAHADCRLIDVDHWRTYLAAAPKALPALTRYGITRLDRSTLLDRRRSVTRTLAGIYRQDATDPLTAELRAAGLRFTSRLPPAWKCWALWEPLPLDPAAAEIDDVTIHTPELRHAADMLGVALVLL